MRTSFSAPRSMRSTPRQLVNLRGKTLFAKAEGQDVYAAIDGLVDKLDRQLVRHKERNGEHRGATAESFDA